MRCFITGGSGFIGSHFVRKCVQRGDDVLNLDKLTYAGDNTRLEDIKNSVNYRFEHADICDLSHVQKTITDFKPDVIVNFAAETHVDRSIDGPSTFIQTNINGTTHLLQVALEYYKSLDTNIQKIFRFVQISTDEVYGDLSNDDPAFTRRTPYAPSSPYSASKAAADHLVRSWHKTFGLPVLITNCSNNYGPAQHPEKLIPHMILSALKGKDLPIYGTGENIRDWIYVTEHNDAVMDVIEKGKVGQTYLIGGNNEITNIDVVHNVCDIMDDIHPRQDGLSYKELITYVTDRPGHDRRYAIDTTDIQNELGWQPKLSFTQGLKETVKWYLETDIAKDYKIERIGLGKKTG